MPSHRAREGYLLIDNRNSPGVPEEMVRASGLKNVAGVGSGVTFESATMTCSHCNSIVVLNPNRTRERGYCRLCDHYVCDNPLCNLGCNSFSRLIDTTQEQAFKQIGKE